MLSFKEFLFEHQRSPERAAKLGAYLAFRHTVRRDPINNMNRHAMGSIMKKIHFQKQATEEERDKVVDAIVHHSKTKGTPWKRKNNPTTHLPIHHLIPTQDTTDFNPDHFKSTKMADDRPILVFHHEGKHYIWDGHHRYMRDRLLGKTHIKAEVHDV